MKTCKSCGEEKTLDKFYIAKRKNGDYILPRCISCLDKQRRQKLADSNPQYLLKHENKKRLSEARERGDTHYLSALPCKSGHLAKRLVSTQQCTACLKYRYGRKERGKINPKKINAYKRKVARNMGKTRFVGVIECPKGHIGERLVSTGQCCECISLRKKSQASVGAKYRASVRKNAKRRKKASKIKQRKYQSEVLYSRPEYKLKRFMYESIRRALAGLDRKKDRSTRDALGYWTEDIKARIEFNFKPGMSWNNYGEWHIDHTIPMSHFISRGEDRISIINALCNLRPMWALENLSKGGKHEKTARRV